MSNILLYLTIDRYARRKRKLPGKGRIASLGSGYGGTDPLFVIRLNRHVQHWFRSFCSAHSQEPSEHAGQYTANHT